MALVFQYGSNMSTGRMNSADRLSNKALVRGAAVTDKKFDFVFDIWSRTGKCAAADIRDGGRKRIWGVIYEIPDHLIRRETADGARSLDEIEGQGKNYQRVEIKVRWRNGRRISEPVITYVGLERKDGLKTTRDYIRHILDGLSENRIPEAHCRYVKKQILENNPALAPVV